MIRILEFVGTLASLARNLIPLIMNTISNIIATKPQYVRWLATSENGPGILIQGVDGKHEEFIAWGKLQGELEQALLSRAFADPRPYTLKLRDHHEKPNWLVRVCRAEDDAELAAVWLGVNPTNGWADDGLVHVGDPKTGEVWQTYQRHSDDRYTRHASRYGTLEEALEDEQL